MKKLFPILVLFIILLSCEKQDSKACYECITYSDHQVFTTITVCGFTEDEIKIYEVGLQDQATCLTDKPHKTICNKK